MIDRLLESTSAIVVIVILVAGLALVGAAAFSVLRERKAEDKVVAGVFALIVLMLVVVGIREYPAVLQGATIEGLRRTNQDSAEFQTEWANLLGGITDPWTEAGGGVPSAPTAVPADTAVSDPGVTIIAPPVTLTPMPTATAVPPTPFTMPEGTPDPASTAPVVLPTPTLQPTVTPNPTIDLSIWNPQTPAPTPIAGGN